MKNTLDKQTTRKMDISSILTQVCSLAESVGKFQREQRRTFRRESVESKRSHDYVSYVDKESERQIVARLKELLPEAEFITEEKTTEQTHCSSQYLWIVDPLDGTTNYIHDLGPWAVCIALKDKDGLLLGVVYEAVREELYYACRGEGAWLRSSDGDSHRLHASAVSDLDQALAMIGFPYDAESFRPLATAMTHRLYGHCASLRSMGSAEAELCYVAAGRIDVYFESYLQPWDVSAGAIIVQEAGGRVSDYSGSDALWPSGREMLATNGLLHDEVLHILRDCEDR